MQNIAIITARGGSKRIPRKNIKLFCGYPIIYYSIKAAIESEIFDEVMVSTDDDEIASISREYGASVPFMRTLKTSDDYATTADVLSEVLSAYANIGKIFETVCCIYPTAPFITPLKLQECFSILTKNDADSIVPVVRFSFPPQRGFVIQDGHLKYQHPENAKKRSQDIDVLYHDAGQFYLFKMDSFKRTNEILTDRTIPYILREIEIQDIDTQDDWELAEIKYKVLISKQP